VSKAHRGKGIRAEQNRGRGVCPVCNKTGIKVLYEQEINGAKTKICKICRANRLQKPLQKNPLKHQPNKFLSLFCTTPALDAGVFYISIFFSRRLVIHSCIYFSSCSL